MLYELEPRYNTRKSFYGKAQVVHTQNDNVDDYKLYSYGTLVARYTLVGETENCFCYGKYSCTTTRHQKEFFRQMGLTDEEIKEVFKYAKEAE